MAVTVGFAGPDVRSDVRVTVSEAKSTTIEIESTVKAIYGDEIEAQARAILASYGSPQLHIKLEDSGALPFIIQGRLEAALSKLLAQPLPAIEPRTANPVRDRLRRSRLYIPGNQPKFMPNAGIYGADCLIFDLEDSVPPAEKEAARALVRRAIATLDLRGAECMVRINSGGQGILDIDAIDPAGPDTYVIPKVESPDQLHEISHHLDTLGSQAGIVAILESALGVQRAFEIASSTSRLVAMTLGIEDYLADIRATDKEATTWANGAILNACRAAGISPLASVTSAVADDRTVEDFARAMASFGFEGVGCIHPSQVEPAHRGFAPTDDELEEAQDIVTQFENAIKEGKGAIAVREKMVDEPVYQRAKRTLSLGGYQ